MYLRKSPVFLIITSLVSVTGVSAAYAQVKPSDLVAVCAGRTGTQSVLISPAHTEIRVIPAKSHSVMETSKVAAEGTQTVSHPAEFATRRERVLVEDAHEAWIETRPPAPSPTTLIAPKTYTSIPVKERTAGNNLQKPGISGPVYMLTNVPAKYEWRDVQVEIKPAWVETVRGQRVITVVKTVVDQPEHRETVQIPAKYQSINCPDPQAQSQGMPVAQPAMLTLGNAGMGLGTNTTGVTPIAAKTKQVVPSSPSEQPQSITPAPTYRLGAGDRVHITVYGEPDLTGDFSISGAGIIAFPLIGDVKAQSLTSAELQTEIADTLTPNYLKDARVNVQMLTFRPFFIMGEVMQPGEYPFSDGLTIGRAIAKAAGFTYRANHKKAMVKHASSDAEDTVVDIDTAAVQPGDVIRIPERYF